jgi:predicted nucleic acid-binding Zn ribbon protein
LTREPEKIGGLIAGYLEKLGFSARLSKQEAVLCWEEIVGPRIAQETQAVRIDGDTLVVKVTKAAWRQQLSFLKGELLAKLDSKLEKGCIKDIRFI